jgi:tRNA (mo5U34)-methyltransferase
MPREELRARADALRWFHTMDLGDGVVTKGVHDPMVRLPLLDLPASLTGRSVLDVGAWDGFFSFEAERRGASRVVAADFYSFDSAMVSLTHSAAGEQRDITGRRVRLAGPVR